MARKSAKQRLRDYLRERVGEVVTSKQLQDAAGDQVTEWARRLRELRTDEGWDIRSDKDDVDLRPGEYRLAYEPPRPATRIGTRALSRRIRSQVLERDGYTCRMCGAAAGDSHADGRPTRLQVGHIVDKSLGGQDELDNLRALCNACNEGAKNLVPEPPSRVWLLSQVRRARVDDQRAVLEWLRQKFEPERPP